MAANENPAPGTGEGAKKSQTSQQAGPGAGREKQQGATAEQASQGQRLSRRELYAPSPFGAGLWAASPFAMIRRMFEDLDRIFEDFGSARGRTREGREIQRGGAWGEAAWVPQVDVMERDGKLVVRADLPGIDKDNLRVEVTGEGLVLEGERRREIEEERGGLYRVERSYGTFRRVIPLPEGIDLNSAEARFDNGVLEVMLPLPKGEGRGKRIEIQEGKQGTMH